MDLDLPVELAVEILDRLPLVFAASSSSACTSFSSAPSLIDVECSNVDILHEYIIDMILVLPRMSADEGARRLQLD